MRGLRLSAVMLAVGLVGGSVASAQDTVIYYHTDAIGSVRMITDANGQVVARYDFLPFGEPPPPSPPSIDDPRRFAGKERDPETGLDYFGARYYASLNGRFTTVDPVLDVEQALTDPQLWNRYVYGRNNPLRYVDPDGLYVTDCAEDDSACQDRAREFEAARRANLRSKDRSVSDAAAAYGTQGARNGVTVYLNAEGGRGARVDPYLSKPANPNIRVVFGSDLSGRELQQAIAHEGSHIQDDMRFINSGFDQRFKKLLKNA